MKMIILGRPYCGEYVLNNNFLKSGNYLKWDKLP